MTKPFLDYYRCPDTFANFAPKATLSADQGFFQFGSDTVCYGRSSSGPCATRADAPLYDVSGDVSLSTSGVTLPFDIDEVITNLLRERYTAHFREEGRLSNAALRRLYYLLRPFLWLSLRKRLQKIHLRNWDRIPFPSWPVDSTVDRIQQRLLALTMQAAGVDVLPFIWFWPEGFTSCAIVTHDVEHTGGKRFCPSLMDIDESFGIRSSFQIVPEDRYTVEPAFLNMIRERGFEVNVHDLKHDGRLYVERGEFQRRAKRINQYAREFGAEGFRSGILYRNADWYDAFDFSYDMSIPNVGHLDPQRGGCCTVMPYFIGDIVELPVTCTQDHTLFNILRDYSIALWERQIKSITSNHGLISILTHPDYLLESRAQSVYKDLLGHLRDLRETNRVWTPLPRDVAAWWRQRNELTLVNEGGTWRIEGAGKERARIAYARLEHGELNYIQPSGLVEVQV